MTASPVTAAVFTGRPVHELVRRHARATPDAVAVTGEGRGVSYRDLLRRADAVAGVLRDAGGVRGLPVAVRMDPGPGLAAAALGVLAAGGHLLCLDTSEAGGRSRAVLEDLRPAFLLLDGAAPAGDDLLTWYRDALGGTVLDAGPSPGSAASPVPSPGTGGDVRTGADADLVAGETPETADAAGGHPDGRADDRLDGWMYVTYTSGSTGRPKGIPQTHRGFAQFMDWFAAEFRIGPGARVAQWAAPGYDASLVEMFAPLTSGATLCPVPAKLRANPEKLAAWLASEGVTHLQTVPSFARRLLEAVTAPGARPPASLGCLLLAGEALTGELADGVRAALPAVRLVNLYGPTESILAAWHEVTGTEGDRVPIGRPIPGRDILVLDGRDRPCPDGAVGDLVVRSPYVTPGYVGAAAGDLSGFRPPPGAHGPDRFYRTGDRGRRTEDGLLEFHGRRDHQVKVNGVRLELGDVESALAAHDSVAECAVVAVPGRHRQVAGLAAYIVPRDPAAGDATPAAWRAALRRWFGRATPPVTFTVVGRLPRTAGGKADRDTLRRLAAIPEPPAPGPGPTARPRPDDATPTPRSKQHAGMRSQEQ
ncbi:amino acid adenylation domain-containing protein [Streptosporangium sp. NPDC004379]|uniref:amino acid adenylation domain-containing protein n=1 Tax=Streptosporangium sp. NPDC004379 TaxID=3366189 RepID=UPI0036B9D94D